MIRWMGATIGRSGRKLRRISSKTFKFRWNEPNKGPTDSLRLLSGPLSTALRRKIPEKWSSSAGIVAFTDRNRVKNGRLFTSIISENIRPVVVISTLVESLVHDESNDIQVDRFRLKNNPQTEFENG